MLNKKRIFLQFMKIYHLLEHGHPIIDYESMKKLFDFIQMLNISQHDWNDTNAWAMAECMYELVLNKTCFVVQTTKFISISVDEVMTTDCQCRISVHVYVVQGWKRIPILLTSE
jgi:hypothetical protein